MASDRVRGDKTRVKVLLDTSMILALFEYSFNLEDELNRLLGSYDIIVPSVVVKELERLSKGGGDRSMNASAALKLIEKYRIIDSDGDHGDDAIIRLAGSRGRFMVATNDKKLRFLLKKKGIPVILLRKKRILCIDE